MTTPAQPTGHIDINLLPDESAFLARTGRNLGDYVALVAPCVDRGVGVGTLPNGAKVLTMTLTVLIPYEHLPLKLSGIAGPDGQPMASSMVTAQIPGAPMVRMLVARTALGDAPRAFVESQTAAPVRPTLIIPDGTVYTEDAP